MRYVRYPYIQSHKVSLQLRLLRQRATINYFRLGTRAILNYCRGSIVDGCSVQAPLTGAESFKRVTTEYDIVWLIWLQ